MARCLHPEEHYNHKCILQHDYDISTLSINTVVSVMDSHSYGWGSTPGQSHHNDNENDNEIGLFRHHNGNNTNIKVIFKQVTMLDKCNCI